MLLDDRGAIYNDGRDRNCVAHALEDSLGRRQRLADGLPAAVVDNHRIGEGATGIDGNSECHLRLPVLVYYARSVLQTSTAVGLEFA